MNKVILLGNLGQDPELKTTPNGNNLASFSIATTSGSKEKKKTEWHRCQAWDKTGELVNQYCKKGSKVMIEGYLKTRQWQTESGEKRFATEIVATHVEFADSKQKKETAAPLTVDEIPF